MKEKTVVEMKYEGDRGDQQNLICVWFVDGKEVYRHKYSDMFIHAGLYGVQFNVRERIIEWAKMLHNPD